MLFSSFPHILGAKGVFVMDQQKIGNFISSLRKERNWTQRELALRLGVTDRAVSKWENGRGLPDLSLLVPLCDALGISVNELLCGARISDNELAQKAQDTLMDALTDSHKKAKHTKRRLLAVLSLIVFLFLGVAAMFAVDVVRMRNNEPIVFSTWGFDYAPPVDTRKERIAQAIHTYMTQEQADNYLRYENEKWFTTMHIYRTEDMGDHDYAYVWVLERSYYLEDGALAIGSGSSIPYRFALTEKEGVFSVTEARIPRDGNYYPIDMEELFPLAVRVQMKMIHHNGVFRQMSRDIEQQAQLYFHLT